MKERHTDQIYIRARRIQPPKLFSRCKILSHKMDFVEVLLEDPKLFLAMPLVPFTYYRCHLEE